MPTNNVDDSQHITSRLENLHKANPNVTLNPTEKSILRDLPTLFLHRPTVQKLLGHIDHNNLSPQRHLKSAKGKQLSKN